MLVADLAAADPVAAVITWLSASSEVTAALGGAGRVAGENLPPYPRLTVTDPTGGDARHLRWLIASAVQIEAIGDLDGTPGKAALRRILWTALASLAVLPDAPVVAGSPVVTAVEAGSAGGWVPLPGGQQRYVATVTVYMHPPVPAGP